MASEEPTRLLRAGLLDGAGVIIAGARAESVSDGREPVVSAVRAACLELGARVKCLALLGDSDSDRDRDGDDDNEDRDGKDGDGAGAYGEHELDELLGRALVELGELDMLVVDAGALFAAAALTASGAGARNGLVVTLEATWAITRTVFNTGFLDRGRPGRVVYLGPAPDPAAAHLRATIAGLENLARTLSIEWARYGVSTVAVAPARDTRAGELAALCCYLASPAGAYFSGCLLDLRGARSA